MRRSILFVSLCALTAITLFPTPVAAEEASSMEQEVAATEEAPPDEPGDPETVIESTFTPGDGPPLRDVLSDEVYQGLPPESQAFIDDHRVGDAWSVKYTEFRSPSKKGLPVGVMGCPNPNNCDIASVEERVDIGASFFFPKIFYVPRALSVIESRRTPPPGPSTWNVSHWLRHHDNFEDFPVTTGVSGPFCNSSYCYKIGSGADTRENRVVFCDSTFSIWPFQVGSCNPDKMFDRFTASQQSRVTDSWGTDNKFCTYVWVRPATRQTGSGSCTYQEPPSLP